MKTQIYRNASICMMLLGYIFFIGCGGQSTNTKLSANTPQKPSTEDPLKTSLLDTFAVQLGANTHKPGRNNADDDRCLDVAIDSQKNMYCVGWTKSDMGEPNAGGLFKKDAVIVKLDAKGKLQWIKQFGALTSISADIDNSEVETFTNIQIDSQDRLFVLYHQMIDNDGPAYMGSTDHIYVTKFDGNGNVLTHSFVTSITTLYSDGEPHAMALDAAGNIYIANEYITKLSPELTVEWSLYIRQAAELEGDVRCMSLAVDHHTPANIYCGGQVDGGNFLYEPPDAVVIKLNFAGQLVWSTQLVPDSQYFDLSDEYDYLGSWDWCSSISVNKDNKVFCTGSLSIGHNTGFYDENGDLVYYYNTDTFILHLTASGTIEWLALLDLPENTTSGQYGEITYDSALKPNGNLVIAGSTTHNLSEAHAGGLWDAFVAEVSSSGEILWKTQFGEVTKASADGSNVKDEIFNALVVDDKGFIYLGGYTSGNMIETNGGPDNIYSPTRDIIMLKLSPTGEL